MPVGTVQETMPIDAARVFEIIHDYGRRLEWDSLLSEAYLEPEYPVAAKSAVSVCRSRRILGSIAIRTAYVTFEKGRVAAVRMLAPSVFFETFAASIRHSDTDDGFSVVIYKYNFTARPRFLQPILHPVMSVVLHWETRKRLSALRAYCRKFR